MPVAAVAAPAAPTAERVDTTAPDAGFADALEAATDDPAAELLDGSTDEPPAGDAGDVGGPADGGASSQPDGGEPLPDPTVDLGQLPTVTLGQMVAAIVDGPDPDTMRPEGGPDALTTAGGPARRDAWGVSADRPASAGSGHGAAVLDAGEQYLGVPYKWGGTSASTGFDCSGFVQQVYADLGVDLPRVSADQSRAGREVPGGMAAAQPGDLVYWNGDGDRPNHIGIYAGEGRMLVAPSSGDVVRYQEISRTPDAVRRVI